MAESLNFKVGDSVVYPSHGVGKVVDIEIQSISGSKLELFVINFEKEKMSLRIPVTKAKKIGLRHLVSSVDMQKVISILQSKAKIAKGMWSRRAAEYENKINSGELLLIAEVVRDLYRSSDDTDRSYSERIIYESALSRLVAEYAILSNVDSTIAMDNILRYIRGKEAA